jgi:hypothetical protein
MGDFMDRINASLPFDEPDYILLRLIKGHASVACGRECPKGQSFAEDGRCMPNVILAKAAKKTLPGIAKPIESRGGGDVQVAWTTETTPTLSAARRSAAADPLPGRMSVGGPRPSATAPPAGWSVQPVPDPRSRSAADNLESVTETAALSARDGPRSLDDDGTRDRTTARNRDASVSDRPQRSEAPVAAAPRRTVVVTVRPARPRYSYRRRSVQTLFTHPLGHM